jgi:glycosyltransferase involved in cell wall biosynthesis
VRRRRLLFVIPYLGNGGAERVMLTLLNNLSREKYDLHLCLIKVKGNYFHQLNADVKVHILGCQRFALCLIKLWKCIHRVKPDIVIGFLSFVNVYLSLLKVVFFRDIIFIARETGLPESRRRRITIGNNLFCRLAYRCMDVVIAQCEYQFRAIITTYKLQLNRVVIIHNPIECNQEELSKSQLCSGKTNIISAGSLIALKNYEAAIDAIRQCSDEDIVLHIFGDGPQRQRLITMVAKHGLENRVIFHEFTHNLRSYFAKADAYLSSSLLEVCSNAMLEAQSCGLPAIAFNAPGANAEIIINDVTGYIVSLNDSAELSRVLIGRRYLQLDRDTIRSHIARNYGIRISISQYEHLLDGVGLPGYNPAIVG